jgi:uncharacterized protein (TIGR02646 family)
LRNITQGASSKCLKGRRYNPPQDTSTAKKAWRRTNKQDIRKACFKQQHGLCAYTELSLDDNKLGHHLEHIAPRSDYPERTFLPNNIVLSIIDDVQSGHLLPHERFGGHHKSEKYSDDWFISPFDEHCSTYFHYSLNGLVEASETLQYDKLVKANKTIRVLNLNADYLVKKRKACLQILKQQIEATQPVEVSVLAEESLKLCEKKLPEFYSAKRQLFESYGVFQK